MDKPERTVRVRMREGLILPLPSEIVRNSSTFVCTPETPIEVLLDHRFTRKRLEAGDFEIVDGDPSELGLPETDANRRRAIGNTEPPFDVRDDGANAPSQPAAEPGERSGFLGSLLHRNRGE